MQIFTPFPSLFQGVQVLQVVLHQVALPCHRILTLPTLLSFTTKAEHLRQRRLLGESHSEPKERPRDHRPTVRLYSERETVTCLILLTLSVTLSVSVPLSCILLLSQSLSVLGYFTASHYVAMIGNKNCLTILQP